nr:immunoglobulin heavy chain junction region [Mus musculus]MBK4195962.1 immunoglobulin heavy chain junction region [Mus musculus]MBK4195965.1 immunoglobulin heavy chain junction region [Mus musculus]
CATGNYYGSCAYW